MKRNPSEQIVLPPDPILSFQDPNFISRNDKYQVHLVPRNTRAKVARSVSVEDTKNDFSTQRMIMELNKKAKRKQFQQIKEYQEIALQKGETLPDDEQRNEPIVMSVRQT